MTNSEWEEVVRHLTAVMDANPFRNCVGCETCYWCIPLGPIQCILCMCNPCTWALYGAHETAKKTAKEQLTPMLTKYQYTMFWIDKDMEVVAVIKPVYG